ncbi:MAG: RNA-binding S4 domain-containing protein [Thermotogae bacterium]|nr:RNA-binding S4 domain-containing protein [Thermotogaceae bacterium]RKX37259.1 MAG: RNA-binding S4 domain-containing protein [Thermotogota bacterium]
MRIDKYLKSTGLIKRRTVANEMIKHNRVLVNGNAVKPSYEIKVADVVVISYPMRTLQIRVLSEKEYVILKDSRTQNFS